MSPPKSSESLPTSGDRPTEGAAALVGSPKRVTLPACGVVVFESRHAPGFRGQIQDPYSTFHLVIAGHARWEWGGRSYLLGPETLFHIPAEQAHRQEDLPNNPVTVYVIHYRPDLLSPTLCGELAWISTGANSPNASGRMDRSLVRLGMPVTPRSSL